MRRIFSFAAGLLLHCVLAQPAISQGSDDMNDFSPIDGQSSVFESTAELSPGLTASPGGVPTFSGNPDFDFGFPQNQGTSSNLGARVYTVENVTVDVVAKPPQAPLPTALELWKFNDGGNGTNTDNKEQIPPQFGDGTQTHSITQEKNRVTVFNMNETSGLILFLAARTGNNQMPVVISPPFVLVGSEEDVELFSSRKSLTDTFAAADPNDFPAETSIETGSPTTDIPGGIKTDIPSSNPDATTSSDPSVGTPAVLGKPNEDSDSGDNGGGLPAGAIAGIVVGGIVALSLALFLFWFLRRRSKKTAVTSQLHHVEAATPLATGYPTNGAATGSRDFMAEKETGPVVAESPRSQMYMDQLPRGGNSRPLSNGDAASLGAVATGGAAAAGMGASKVRGWDDGHQQGYDGDDDNSLVEAQQGRRKPQPPGSPTGDVGRSGGVNSPAPSATVARHLVEEDMTVDDIVRLEEEERELDRQIQEAGKRKGSRG